MPLLALLTGVALLTVLSMGSTLSTRSKWKPSRKTRRLPERATLLQPGHRFASVTHPQPADVRHSRPTAVFRRGV